MSSDFWHAHAHSRFSTLDGMPSVAEMVEVAARHHQPALALTDHGLMSGSLQLYKECRKAGIQPFPGIEAYIVNTLDKTSERYHICLLALNMTGYQALVELSKLSFSRDHFHRKPRIAWDELLEFGKTYGRHVAVLTGCYFGKVVQALVNESESKAREVMRLLKIHFHHVYVEVQMHGIVHPNDVTDADIAESLFWQANNEDLPLVATQDAHYTEMHHKPVHEMMKRLGYSVSDDSEILFPGNSYHLASTRWMEKQFVGSERIWNACQLGLDDLLHRNYLEFPEVDKYKFRVPRYSRTSAIEELRRLVRTGHGPDMAVFDSYTKRIKYELATIERMHFADYFLLVEDFARWCRQEGIIYNTRGSANGSLVCFILGITHVDPVQWGISFDRFLHPSREKPPDIDIDVERDRRHEIVAYLASRYEVTPIGTFSKLGATGDRGSIFVKYLSYKRKLLGQEFKQSDFAGISSLWDLDKLVPDDAEVLRQLAEMEVFTGGGKHAAGYLVSDDNFPLSKYVPTMLVGGVNGSEVSQMMMDDAELAGYVKVDLLGLAALTTMSQCLQLIGHDPAQGLTWIPDDDQDVLAEMSLGKTGTAVFQFEGYATAKGAKEMKLRSTKDAILCLALYRPAVMEGGQKDDYLRIRKSGNKPDYIHPVFERHTNDTLGVFVLQDQVIDVLRGIGMSYADLNDMLKAVKASNERIAEAKITFARLTPVFKNLCRSAGMTQAQADLAWRKVMGFSDYGFNRAHATSYGLMGYRMAWLKHYHLLEFMAATLRTWAGTPKESTYTTEARRLGIKILKPDPNLSQENWSIEGKSLRRGLRSVKGMGTAAIQKTLTLRADKPFTDTADVQKRAGKRIYEALKNSRALEGLDVPNLA